METFANRLKSGDLKIISRIKLIKKQYRKTFSVSPSGCMTFSHKDQTVMDIQPDNGVELANGTANGKSSVFMLIPKQKPDDKTRFDFYKLKNGALVLNLKRLLEGWGFPPKNGNIAIRVEHVEKNVYTFRVQIQQNTKKQRK